jgi:hypothetical protein
MKWHLKGQDVVMWNELIWNNTVTGGGWLPKHFLFHKRIPLLTKPQSESEAAVCFTELTMFSEQTRQVRLCMVQTAEG